jgi:class 3 adenylate cyclase
VEASAGGAVFDQWLQRCHYRVALVFADIVGSTLLIHSRGTEVYARVLSSYRERADRLAEGLDGRIVSREGDEIFAVFAAAGDAYRFARGLVDDAGHPLLTARVGLHVGTVHPHDEGLIGRAVPFAARVMAHGAPHEFWTSDAAKTAIEHEMPAVADRIPWVASEECVLDGVPAPQRLWRIASEPGAHEGPPDR